MDRHPSLSRQRCRFAKMAMAAVFLATTLATTLHAQKTTGGIEGTITDATGAVVPGVRVTATDEGTGERLVATSDQGGTYRFLEVRPDSYLVTVEAAGFKQM